jgi:hypothetical protein
MPKTTPDRIARKAREKAEADFATWLMMAKLGSFDQLPPDAQKWLLSYQPRLAQMSETDATRATVAELYAAYYAQMGGTGAAPDFSRMAVSGGANVVALKDARRAKATHAGDNGSRAPSPRTLQPFLIFAGMVAAIAAIKFAFGW